MDVQRTTRERYFSILNDNDCPSFQHKQKTSSPSLPPQKLPSIASLTAHLDEARLERPSLFRLPQFQRNNSISSAGSPPLLRYDSSSSAKSSSSMDSTPSPITPAYNYDNDTLHYNALPNPAITYLPSPTGITPFMDQTLMIGPVPQDPYQPKPAPVLAPAVFPAMPATANMAQIPTPALSADIPMPTTAPANTQHKAAAAGGNPPQKKNKYPCPYAQSHNCSATFTTSGHAARHGKKHTGEKGVHCPICDKAFTRKDNMKQHERTHKNRPQKDEEKKSKAQATREASKLKEPHIEDDSQVEQSQIPLTQQSVSMPPHPAQIRKSSSGNSEPSDITLNPVSINTPLNMSPPDFFDTVPQIVLPQDTTLGDDIMAVSAYPPLDDETLAAQNALLMPNNKLEVSAPQPPQLVRGFSDLDTLAQAAETFDPYFQPAQF